MAAASDLALVQGLAHTRETLTRWNAAPWAVLRDWLLASLAIAVVLLLTVIVLGTQLAPYRFGVSFAGVTQPADLGAAGEILKRNSLVLALHGFACVAGFIAGSSLPVQAEQYSGFLRRIHDRAGTLAIAFVALATTFSLVTQVLSLGHGAATLSHQLGMSVPLLILALTPHAIPELMALFLPLAAWVIASRRGDWHELLAATFVTVGLAIPTLVLAAFVEVYVSPHLILALRG